MWPIAFIGAVSLLTSIHGSIIVYTQETPHSIEQEFRDLPASFGPDLPSEGLRGFLVAGNPSNGCTALDKAPLVDNFTGKWVVIVARYDCSFEVKVRNAQLAGFDCAIVHNVNSSDLENMSAKSADDIIIPSVFVNDVAGVVLSEQYTYTSGFYVMVNGDMPFNINTHLLLPFAIVVVLCLVIILIFMIVKCIKDRRRARRHRLPNRALKKIPTCKFCKGDPYETCAICLDDYQEGERLRVLPCAHAYHAVCIDPWLTQNKRVCPVCKRRVWSAGERRARTRHSDSDSDDDTEPLLADRVIADAPQSGGTFDEQQENPFRRAARFMSRLRARQTDGNEDRVSNEDSEHHQQNDNDRGTTDTAPLIQPPPPPPAVSAVSERRTRRSRRARARSAGAGGAAPGPAPGVHVGPAPGAHVGPSGTRSLLHSDTHSINNDTRGEIGVAALPAPRDPSSPRHIDL